jgi:GT2 family glycosyltransferase
MDGLAVSVVVPTCGRPELLRRCLAAVCDQSLAGARYEVIVVDDRPRLLTAYIVAMSQGRAGPLLVYLPNHGRHGPAAARNLGWRAARSGLVAFTDDDTVADADWLREGLAALDSDTGALCGRVVVPLPSLPSDYERDANRLELSEFVTANCFCRKTVLERAGGFDERFRMAWREDSDLHFRLLDMGVRVGHAPQSVVVHPVRPAPWGVSLLQQRKIMFDALLQKKHPRHYRLKIRPHPRWDYHATLALLLAAGGGLAADSAAVAALASAGWLGLTVRLCRRRLAGTSRRWPHVAEMVVTSALIPPYAEFWRAAGVLRFGLPPRRGA